jgi:hypothetical protein
MKTGSTILLALTCFSLGVSAQTLSNYQTTVKAQTPSFYFTFDGGSLTNTVGSLTPTLSANPSATASQLVYDIFQNPSDCMYFSLSPSANADDIYDTTENADHIISGGGAAGTNTSTAVGTITLLFRTGDPGPPSGSTTGPGAKCIFSAGGATSSSNALYLQIENANATNNANDLRLAFGDSVTLLLPATNVVWDTWYYFALTYNESATNANGSPNTNKATWYLGRLNGAGALASGKTINSTNAVAGDGVDFVIGSQTTRNSGFCKPGDGRVDEFASWTNRQLSAAEIQAQFTNLPNPQLPLVSAYQTVISNQAPAHYFQLAGNTLDSMNPALSLATNIGTILVTNPPFNTSVGYSYDYFLDQNGAAYFSLGADAIYTNINLLNGGGTYNSSSPGSGKGSISGMFHGLPCTNYNGSQVFIFDAGGNTGNSNAFSLYLENSTTANPWSLKLHFGDSSGVLIQGTNASGLPNVLSEWYYFAVTYDETVTNRQAHWWVGQPGATLKSGFFSAVSNSLAGAGNTFYIGNQSGGNLNAFRYQKNSHTGNGQVSQFTIWNRLLTTNEVAAQFSALSVSAGPPPTLSIAASGTNAIISWPSSTDSGYALQSTTNLASPNWLSAGVSAVVGTNNVVTNSISGSAQFYRLKK